MRKRRSLLFLPLGLGLVAWLIWRSDPSEVWRVLKSVGPWAPVILLPYGLVYLVDTLGWRLSFGRRLPNRLTFGRLIPIRWAGESVNTLVPSGYVGGEAVKVYLLRKAGVSGWTGTASVVVSKTVQTLAQVLFIGTGAFLGALHLPAGSPMRAALWSVAGLAAVVLVLLVGTQQYGFFKSVNCLAAVSKRWQRWFERHGERIREADHSIRSFYLRQPKAFLASTAAYSAGWLCDAVEILVVSAILGWEVNWSRAVTIEAFIGVAKALGAFIPASLGVQESGVVLLFRAFGLTSTQALAYALVRRARELVYALVGLLLLWVQDSEVKLLKPKSKQETANAR